MLRPRRNRFKNQIMPLLPAQLTNRMRDTAQAVARSALHFFESRDESSEEKAKKADKAAAAERRRERAAFLALPKDRREARLRVAAAAYKGGAKSVAALKAAHENWPGVLDEAIPMLKLEDWDAVRTDLGLLDEDTSAIMRVKGSTLLMLAANQGNVECVKLLASVASVDRRNERGESALSLAISSCEMRDADSKRAIVATLSAVADINAVDDLGQTPLILAARYENQDAFDALVANARCDAWKKTPRGESALSNAVMAGNVEMIKWLTARCSQDEINAACKVVIRRIEDLDEPSLALLRETPQRSVWRGLDLLGSHGSKENREALFLLAGTRDALQIALKMPMSSAMEEASELRAEIRSSEQGDESHTVATPTASRFSRRI